jgi:hypothetical protein
LDLYLEIYCNCGEVYDDDDDDDGDDDVDDDYILK